VFIQGKTLFEYYTLIRLLQQKQIVLFSSRDSQRLYLFYHDVVYTILTNSVTELPLRKISSSDVFIWSLFDIPERNEPKLPLTYPPCMPIQIAPADDCRFRKWELKCCPLLTGLSLWTREELAHAYVLLILSLYSSAV